MSTGQSIASPRAPRGQRQPSAAQPGLENSAGRQSQRRPRGGRNHHNHAQASPNKASNVDPSLSEGGGAYTTDDARAPPRSAKKHARGQPSHDRTFSPMAAQTSLTDTEAIANRASATPLKTQGAYAGPTFHASPAPSALPIPKFLSRSVPAKTAPGPPTPPPDHSSGSDSASPSPSPSRAPIAIPTRHDDSPLDMLFRADKAERAKNTTFSPNQAPVRPQQHQQEYNVFPIELEGETRNPHMSPPPFHSPAGHRSVTDPSRVPQLKDVQQPNNGNDVMQDLMNRLSMSSQKNPQAPMATPPRQAPQAPGNFQSPQFTPSPFYTGRTSVNRSASGPTTPAQAPQDGPEFFYGNRNLSPMFKAAQDETPKRNSGLRTEVTADSPTVQQNMFQDFPSIPSASAMDPNTFSRGQPPSSGQEPTNTRRGSVPYGQSQQRQPSKHVTQTPGRYQQRQDNNQRGRGNFYGQGPRHGRPAVNAAPATAPRPATTMMSFVPASVSAKPKAKPAEPLAASAPPATAVLPPKTSTPDTLALEQDLKRMLNLNLTGEGVR